MRQLLTIDFSLTLVPTSVNEARQMLAKTEILFSPGADRMIDRMSFQLTRYGKQILFIVASVRELGFPKGGILSQVAKSAQENFGLYPVPASFVPVLRTAYRNQPLCEYLSLAMDPIIVHGRRWVFTIGHGGKGLWILADTGDPDKVWCGSWKWVFLSPLLPIT